MQYILRYLVADPGTPTGYNVAAPDVTSRELPDVQYGDLTILNGQDYIIASIPYIERIPDLDDVTKQALLIRVLIIPSNDWRADETPDFAHPFLFDEGNNL